MLEDVAVATWIRTGGREVGLSGLIEADCEARALARVPAPEALLEVGFDPAAAVKAAWPEYPLMWIEPDARADALSMLWTAQKEKDEAQARVLADRAIHLLSDALGFWAEGAGRFPEVNEVGWERQSLWLSQDLGVEVLGGPLGAHRRPYEKTHTVRLMDDERVEIGAYEQLTESEARLLGVTPAVLPPDACYEAMMAMRFGLTCRSYRRPDGDEMSTLASLRILGRSTLAVIADLEPAAGQACAVELISAGEVVPLVELATRVSADRLDDLAEALLGIEDEQAVRRLLADYTVSELPDRLPEWLVGAA